MELKEINNKEQWENFLLEQTEKTFLQSWNWGEFNSAMGSKIWRFGIYNDERLIAIALVYKISARRGTFLFIPHGPVVAEDLANKDKKEILEFANRLEAASLLTQDVQYNAIIESTGLSSTTIARISKWLKGSLGGYRLILARLNHHNSSKLGKGLSLN